MKKLAGEIKQPKRKPQGGVQERKATAFPLLFEGENKKRAIGAEPVLRDMNESPRGKIESRMASGLAGLLAEIGDCCSGKVSEREELAGRVFVGAGEWGVGCGWSEL